jgi:periplasmic protein TonB
VDLSPMTAAGLPGQTGVPGATPLSRRTAHFAAYIPFMAADSSSPGRAVSPDPAPSPPTERRNVVIAALVLGLHLGLLWVLQNGLLMRAAETVVPVRILAQIIEPPAPKPAADLPRPPELVQQPPSVEKPRSAAAKTPPQPKTRELPPPRPPLPAKPAPAEPAILATPAPDAARAVAPASSLPPALPSPSPPAPPVAAAPPAPAAPPAVQLPSSDADYLQNPKPPYPPMSRRLGEQGTTTLRVLIGVDGQPQRAEVTQSSGFDRLDQAAMATAMRWRYVPGKRGGVVEAMWVSVPIIWTLN